MKTRDKILIGVTLFAGLLTALPARAQGAFQNLNFEAAIVPGGPFLPGWSYSAPFLTYDNFGSGSSLVILIDSNGFPPLQGKYSVILLGGSDYGYNGPVSISQTGLLPAYTRSIQMEVAFPLGNVDIEPWIVKMGGQTIPMAPVQVCSNYTIYGGDISAFAGKVETLTITQEPPPYQFPFLTSAVEIDNIVMAATQLTPLQLTILYSGTNVIVSWPTNYTGYTLQSTTNLVSPLWNTNLPSPVVVSTNYTVTDTISGTTKFYRLQQ